MCPTGSGWTQFVRGVTHWSTPRGLRVRRRPCTHSTNVLPHGSMNARVEAVELRPVVVTPQDRGAPGLGFAENAVHGVVVGDEDPRARRVALGGQRRAVRHLPDRDGGGRWRHRRSPCAGCRSARRIRRRAGSSCRERCDGTRLPDDPPPPSRRRRRRTPPTRRGRSTGSPRRSTCWDSPWLSKLAKVSS